ncbi:MAG: DUF4328 domain-containing protein, partial [Chlorobi bacterium]|nr:DUF4328 domain-containing protein [Chlorobiota bacterium]
TVNEKKYIKPNKERADIAIKLIWLVMLIEIISATSSFFQYRLLMKISKGEIISVQVANANDTREQIVAIVYLIVFFISGITFIKWFRRAYYNLGVRTKTNYTEGWAAGAWFVPIISLFRPVQIMNELWDKTSKLISEKTNTPTTSRPVIIGIWWALWILSHFIGRYVLKLGMKAETIDDYINSTVGDMVISILGIPLAIITVLIINSYSKKEEELARIEKQILEETLSND